MKYAYICTNYNNAHFTEAAVASLNAGEAPPSIIVVVDNDSHPADRKALERVAHGHANVRLLLNEENVGYFPGLNDGIGLSRELCDDLAGWVIGNNDLEFPTQFGRNLEAVLADAVDRPVVSPYIETLDGLPQNPHVVAGISRLRELMYDLFYSSYLAARTLTTLSKHTRRWTNRSDEEGHAEPQYIYQGHGSCYVLTPKFFELFDRLWAPTFLMGEEFFLSHQLMSKGKMVFYDPRIRIRHRCNGSLEKVPGQKVWSLAKEAHGVYRRYVKPWRRQDWSDLSSALQQADRDARRS